MTFEKTRGTQAYTAFRSGPGCACDAPAAVPSHGRNGAAVRLVCKCEDRPLFDRPSSRFDHTRPMCGRLCRPAGAVEYLGAGPARRGVERISFLWGTFSTPPGDLAARGHPGGWKGQLSRADPAGAGTSRGGSPVTRGEGAAPSRRRWAERREVPPSVYSVFFSPVKRGMTLPRHSHNTRVQHIRRRYEHRCPFHQEMRGAGLPGA